MNHAAGAVTPPDAEPVKAGDVAEQPTQRRGLVQGASKRGNPNPRPVSPPRRCF
jgi:hypothetical protein